MATRREVVVGLGAFAIAGRAGRSDAQARGALADIARDAQGRLGVFAFDTGTGRRIGFDADSRYALCSTFKAPLAAAILARVDAGSLSLNRAIRFGETDLLDHAPVVRPALSAGMLPVERLAEAAVVMSDNSAANLLLPQLGGPQGLTRWLRSIGDPVSRLDRDEPTLNVVRGGDVRDTTTPMAIAMTLRTILFGEALAPGSRARLMGWMEASETGLKRLRAGFPREWRAGDKTGTSGEGCFNDIAFAIPPGRKPILVACYLDSPGLDPVQADAIHARVGALIGRLFA